MSLQNSKSSFMTSVFGFPSPKFLYVPAVGINISDHSIKVLELVSHKDFKTIGRYINQEIPDGVIVSGIVKRDADFVSILKKIKNDLNITFIRASVPEENAYSFNITLPNLSEEETYNTIKFQLAEHVPLTPEESIFDYDVVGVSDNKTDLSISVLPKRVVDQYTTFFSAVGLIPIALEIEAQTLARAVIPKGDKKITMIVDIGRTRTGVSIVSGTIVHYTSTLEMGGDSFITAVQKTLGVTFIEADKLKQEKGFIKESAPDIFVPMTETLSRLKDELSRRFDYWYTHISKANQKERKIEKIILGGGNATTPGLKEELESYLSVPVEIGNVWTNAFSFDQYVPDIDLNNSLGYASAVGLALSEEM